LEIIMSEKGNADIFFSSGEKDLIAFCLFDNAKVFEIMDMGRVTNIY
jgi:hypothetical protein